MAKSRVYKKGTGQGGVDFNMTPMIDVTFQLIVFFILAGQMASDELANLSLHRPYRSQAVEEEKLGVPNRVVVNILSVSGDRSPEAVDPLDAGMAKYYMISKKKIDVDDYDGLKKILGDRKKAASDRKTKFYVEIRADHRVAFEYVKHVMDAAADVKIAKVKFSALLKERGSDQ